MISLNFLKTMDWSRSIRNDFYTPVDCILLIVFLCQLVQQNISISWKVIKNISFVWLRTSEWQVNTCAFLAFSCAIKYIFAKMLSVGIFPPLNIVQFLHWIHIWSVFFYLLFIIFNITTRAELKTKKQQCWFSINSLRKSKNKEKKIKCLKFVHSKLKKLS